MHPTSIVFHNKALVIAGGIALAGAVTLGVIAWQVNRKYHSPHLPEDPQVRAAADSVVQVMATSQAQSGSDHVQSGSGWVADKGLVFTAEHVIAGAREIQIANWDGSIKRDATVVYRDPKTDVAVLRVDDLNLKPLSLGPANPAETNVTRMGYPGINHSYFDAHPVSIDNDWIPQMVPGSEVPRSLAHGDGSHGTSGGPIVDGDGRVLGMVHAYDKDADVTVAISNADIRRVLVDFTKTSNFQP